MGFNATTVRSLNIFDKHNQEILKITNIKAYNKMPLYDFTLNGKTYREIVGREILSNGNSSIKNIGYVEKEKYLKNPLEYETSKEYIDQGYECPKCKKRHTLEKDDLFLCLECGFQGKEKQFI